MLVLLGSQSGQALGGLGATGLHSRGRTIAFRCAGEQMHHVNLNNFSQAHIGGVVSCGL